jgi:hypothetical protein
MKTKISFETLRRVSAPFFVLLLVACGGGGGGGGDGGVSGTSSAVIPANGTTLKTISPGDLITYNVTVTDTSYDWDGTVLSRGTADTTMDLSYYTSNLVLTDGTPLMLERGAFGDGTVADGYFVQLSDGTLVDYIDENGYYYYDIDNANYGVPRLISPLTPYTTWSVNYYRVSGGSPERVGVRTVSVGGLETIDTPLGRIEAYRVTVTESEEDAGPVPSVGPEVWTETNWVNPEIGIVRAQLIEERYFGSTLSGSTEIIVGITSVSFPIPAAE